MAFGRHFVLLVPVALGSCYELVVVVALHDALCFTDMDDLEEGKISPIFLNEFASFQVQFSPGVRKFSLSRASMISPHSKLKMFTGSVCVLLTSVSLKLIKIKIKLIYATTGS